MSRFARTALAFLGILLALVCFALFVYYPAFPKSVAGWLGLLFIGVPLIFFFEWLGNITLGVSFFNRLPSAGRVALGVPIVILVMVVVKWLAGSAALLINR
ncbi:MAG: hypothetical protein HYY98_01375 [Burkholderiales bacterium]|nr:hypothetical protein [Burkholderiales bacterium]